MTAPGRALAILDAQRAPCSRARWSGLDLRDRCRRGDRGPSVQTLPTARRRVARARRAAHVRRDAARARRGEPARRCAPRAARSAGSDAGRHPDRAAAGGRRRPVARVDRPAADHRDGAARGRASRSNGLEDLGAADAHRRARSARARVQRPRRAAARGAADAAAVHGRRVARAADAGVGDPHRGRRDADRAITATRPNIAKRWPSSAAQARRARPAGRGHAGARARRRRRLSAAAGRSATSTKSSPSAGAPSTCSRPSAASRSTRAGAGDSAARRRGPAAPDGAERAAERRAAHAGRRRGRPSTIAREPERASRSASRDAGRGHRRRRIARGFSIASCSSIPRGAGVAPASDCRSRAGLPKRTAARSRSSAAARTAARSASACRRSARSANTRIGGSPLLVPQRDERIDVRCAGLWQRVNDDFADAVDRREQRRVAHDHRGEYRGRHRPTDDLCGERRLLDRWPLHQTFDARRDSLAADEGTGQQTQCAIRRREAGHLEQRGRQRKTRVRIAGRLGIRGVFRGGRPFASRRRLAGSSDNASGVARMASRFRLSHDPRCPISCSIAARNSSGASASTSGRVTSSFGRNTPTSVMAGTPTSRQKTGTGAPGSASGFRPRQPRARAADRFAQRRYAAPCGGRQDDARRRGERRRGDAECFVEITRLERPE